MAQMGSHLVTAGGKRPGRCSPSPRRRPWRAMPGADRRGRQGRRDPRWRVGGAGAGGLAVPRRRDRRSGDPPGRRERQRPLGQPQGDPRRRLPARQGLGDRRRPRHRGRRPARRHHRPALRGRGARAAPRLRPDPHRGVLPHGHRGQDGRAVRHRLPGRRDRRRPAPRAIDQLTEFGRRYGMAFQIVDDVLDVIATDEQLGKPAGHDIAEGIYNLPVLHALEELGGDLGVLLGGPIDGADLDTARRLVAHLRGVDRSHRPRPQLHRRRHRGRRARSATPRRGGARPAPPRTSSSTSKPVPRRVHAPG